jgi:hypothetical protein
MIDMALFPAISRDFIFLTLLLMKNYLPKDWSFFEA